ncbi:MAG: LURP-one-related family protein [Ktedonobacterales bacterium]|nr:LURP-one-related family protein [Ktedonobacterales bacterium]
MRYVIREKFFQLVKEADITDESGQPVFRVDHTLLALRHRVTLHDAAGNEVASITRRLIALRPTYEITRGGQELAEVRKHLFTPFGDRFTVDVPGPDDLEIKGNLFEHEYTITRGGAVVATVSKRWLSLRNTYAVEVAAGQDDALILASILALDLAEDRERG